MSVKIGLKYIDIWNDSMEQAVCEYEKEEIKKAELFFTAHPILQDGVKSTVTDRLRTICSDQAEHSAVQIAASAPAARSTIFTIMTEWFAPFALKCLFILFTVMQVHSAIRLRKAGS